eukprot:gene14924-20977_t
MEAGPATASKAKPARAGIALPAPKPSKSTPAGRGRQAVAEVAVPEVSVDRSARPRRLTAQLAAQRIKGNAPPADLFASRVQLTSFLAASEAPATPESTSHKRPFASMVKPEAASCQLPSAHVVASSQLPNAQATAYIQLACAQVAASSQLPSAQVTASSQLPAFNITELRASPSRFQRPRRGSSSSSSSTYEVKALLSAPKQRAATRLASAGVSPRKSDVTSPPSRKSDVTFPPPPPSKLLLLQVHSSCPRHSLENFPVPSPLPCSPMGQLPPTRHQGPGPLPTFASALKGVLGTNETGYIILELFSGRGSHSLYLKEAMAHKLEHKTPEGRAFRPHVTVFRLDCVLREPGNPELHCDILTASKELVQALKDKFPLKRWIILASPPCTVYSRANTTGDTSKEALRAADKFVAIVELFTRTLGGITILENPATGKLKTREVIKFLEYTVEVDYCVYGGLFRKPTKLWFSHDLSVKEKKIPSWNGAVSAGSTLKCLACSRRGSSQYVTVSTCNYFTHQGKPANQAAREIPRQAVDFSSGSLQLSVEGFQARMRSSVLAARETVWPAAGEAQASRGPSTQATSQIACRAVDHSSGAVQLSVEGFQASLGPSVLAAC